MILITGPASPYGRKARIVAIETGGDARVEIELVPPGEIAARTTAHNPMAKVPVLIRDNGNPLYDSPVICEYLDSLHSGEKLFPEEFESRWAALRLQALGDGLGEAVGTLSAELSRPEPSRQVNVIASQSARIARALDYLEAHMDELAGPLNIGQVAVACGIGYTDFREVALDWRTTRPQLAHWFQAFSQRESMRRTFYRRPGAGR